MQVMLLPLTTAVPASSPMATLKLPVEGTEVVPAYSPTATLKLPVVQKLSAPLPIAVLEEPVTLLKSANVPTAVLLFPMPSSFPLSLLSAAEPIAVLLLPETLVPSAPSALTRCITISTEASTMLLATARLAPTFRAAITLRLVQRHSTATTGTTKALGITTQPLEHLRFLATSRALLTQQWAMVRSIFARPAASMSPSASMQARLLYPRLAASTSPSVKKQAPL